MSEAARTSRAGGVPSLFGRITCVASTTLPFSVLAASITRDPFSPSGVCTLTSRSPPILAASSSAVAWWSGAPFEPFGFGGAGLLSDLLKKLLIPLIESEIDCDAADVNVLRDRWPDGVLKT